MGIVGPGRPKLNHFSDLNIRGRPEQVYVIISHRTRDGGLEGEALEADASTKLQPGLLVVPYTGGVNVGTWGHYDYNHANGKDDEHNVGVLLDFVDVSNGSMRAHVAVGGEGTFDSKQFRYATIADKTNADLQHLTISFV